MLYSFADCTLNTDRRELRRNGDLVTVTPQVFDLLQYLICHRETVVSKDDLIAAVWKGRIVSESALTTRINGARSAIGDSGEQQRLIRTLARKGIRFVGEVHEERDAARMPAEAVEQPKQPFDGTDRPSIAVLPFSNMSGDPEQEYFADGIVVDIITALSRFKSLFVIARNSTFTYKGEAVDVRKVGRELSVRYVLEGSVRKAGNRLRITGQLVEAATGEHLWADKFDGTPEDVFDLQDRVTSSVVAVIAPKIEQVEIERIAQRPTDNLQAYDYYLRGMSTNRTSSTGIDEAIRNLRKAIELDPNFAAATCNLAVCYNARRQQGFAVDRKAESAEAVRYALRALELGRDDSSVLATSAFTLAYQACEVDSALSLVGRALELNANDAQAWWYSGWIQIYAGFSEVAIGHFLRALQLNPLDRFNFSMMSGLAFAHFFAGRNDQALVWAERALIDGPTHMPALRILVAASALSGQPEKCARALARLLQVHPSETISSVPILSLLRNDNDRQRMIDGFRIAGLPE